MVDFSKLTDGEYKVLENHVRRAAWRQGLHLEKSPTCDPRVLDYSKYWLLDNRNVVVFGRGHCATLDEIAEYLNEPI